jgi:hypothetical protein
MEPDGKFVGRSVIDHGTRRLHASFGSEWRQKQDGREIILTSHDNAYICQSLLVPRSEFDQMTPSGIEDIVEQTVLLERQIYSSVLPVGVEPLISTDVLLNVPGPPFQVAFSITESVSMSGKTSNVHKHYAWTGDSSNAAGLTCGPWRNLTRYRDIEMVAIVKGYRLQDRAHQRAQ